MKFQLAALGVLLCLAASPVAARDQTAPKEADCRLAIEAGLEQLRRVPSDLNRRDDEERRKLLAEMERLVEEKRRAGVSECRTWSLLMGRAFNQ